MLPQMGISFRFFCFVALQAWSQVGCKILPSTPVEEDKGPEIWTFSDSFYFSLHQFLWHLIPYAGYIISDHHLPQFECNALMS